MNKAEKRACQYTGYCRNQSYTDFLKGYQQAEKDLELTWEDIEAINQLLWDLCEEYSGKKDNEGYYQEVLKRFNKERKEK